MYGGKDENDWMKWGKNNEVHQWYIKSQYTCVPYPDSSNQNTEYVEHHLETVVYFEHKEKLKEDQCDAWEVRIKKYDKIKKQLREDKLKEDTKKLKKWFYFFSTWLVAIPTTIFATDKFVQEPLLDVVIAFSIGFAIYRAQDIQKAFTKEVKTPKVADKNSTPVVKVPPAGHHNGGKHPK